MLWRDNFGDVHGRRVKTGKKYTSMFRKMFIDAFYHNLLLLNHNKKSQLWRKLTEWNKVQN